MLAPHTMLKRFGAVGTLQGLRYRQWKSERRLIMKAMPAARTTQELAICSERSRVLRTGEAMPSVTETVG